MAYVSFSESSIYHNLKRTAKLGLISVLDRNNFENLINKYYRDSQGVLHCAYTWHPINQSDLELEHIIPVSLGGGTVIFNCVPSSSIINGRGQKYNNYLFDWWIQSGYYSEELLEKLINFMFDGYRLFINNGLTFEETKLDEFDVDDFEMQQENFDDDLDIIGDNSNVIKNSYIYYTFFKDCVDRLNNEKYKVMLEDLKKTNVFNLICDYDEYLFMFKEYLNQKSMLDLSTIAINCNIPKIISSLNLTKDNFISTIDNKINNLYKEIIKKVNYNLSIDTVLINILNFPEIILYEELTDEFINNLINKIQFSKNDKFKLLLEYYKKYNQWPIKEKTEKMYNFSISGFMSKVRSGEISITEEQYNEILNLDSKFFMNQNERSTSENVYEIIVFYKKFGRKPRQLKNPINDEERYESLLASAINRIKCNSSNLSSELKEMLLLIEPDFFENINDLSTRKTIEMGIQYFKNNGKWPSRNDTSDDNVKLASRLVRLRNMEELLPDDLILAIKKLDPKFFMNQNDRQTDDTITSLIDFYEIYGRWPSRKRNPQNEAERYESKLAGRLQNIRFGGINITKEQKIQLENLDETVFYDQKELHRVNNCKLVLDFYDSHNSKWPRIIDEPTNLEEVQENELGQIFRNIRKSQCLPEKYKQEFLNRDKNIFMNQNDRQTQELIIKILEYFDTYNMWPQKIGKPVTEAEIIGNELSSSMHAFRSRLNSKILETHKELILEILKRDIHFFEPSGELSVKQKLEIVKDMFIKNGHWPLYKEDKKLNSFMSNILTGKIALTKIQIKELKLLDDTFDISNIKVRPLYINISTRLPNGKEEIIKHEIIDEPNNKLKNTTILK